VVPAATLRLDDSGGESDEKTIALCFTNWSRSGAVELYDQCVARTERLVASWRFQDLDDCASATII
jgi:hypothetical protein